MTVHCYTAGGESGVEGVDSGWCHYAYTQIKENKDILSQDLRTYVILNRKYKNMCFALYTCPQK